MPTLTDAEIAFYQSVIDDPEGKSLSDLRYAYFLAALDGGLPAPPVEVPEGLSATGTANAATYLRGDGVWGTPPNTTYPLIGQGEVENPLSTLSRLISGQRLSQGVAAFFRAVSGYNAAVAQTLEHDTSGALIWVDKA